MTDDNWILVDDGNETRVSGFGSGLVLLVNPFYNSKRYQNFKFHNRVESQQIYGYTTFVSSILRIP